MSVFDKISQVKKLFPDIEEQELLGVTQRLANRWHYNEKRKQVKLAKSEVAIYEVLINNGLNPSTVYKWLLLTQVPGEVRSQIRHGELNIQQVLAKKREIKSLNNMTSQEVMKQIRDAVERYIIR